MNLGRIIAGVVLTVPFAPLSADTFVPSVFSDHMVVQQKTPLKVFGKDTPGQKVTVSFQDQQASATADKDGKWQLAVTPPPAGGPYTMTIAGSSSKAIQDILVGEVWLCSGQSNMQFGLSGAQNGPAEVAAANYSTIRFFSVPNVRSATPQQDVDAHWQACSPATAGYFSAIGYFFGRQLHQQLDVPVGLINSSWGGTFAEAWTPREALVTLPGMEKVVDLTDADIQEQWRKYGDEMAQWLAGMNIRNEAGDRVAWAAPVFDDAQWKTMPEPTNWQNQGITTNAIMWFRKTVELPANVDAHAPATLELGAIDDFDVTFVNGKQVGAMDVHTKLSWSVRRKYSVPAGVLKSGKNVIAIRVVDIAGAGGFGGPAEAMQLTLGDQRMPLAGDWKYAMEREVVIPFDAVRPASPTSEMMATQLYNAMINPFAGYPIAGVIWYQGENNSGNPAGYRQLLPVMINSWRQHWDQQFPFLIVQLAGFMKDSGDPGDGSGWPAIRDAQRQIAQDTPKCGLAVAIDIGDATDIHPRNKLDVGRRLALQALRIAYGKNIVASGPTIQSAKADDGKVILTFDNVGDGLVAKDNSLARNFALQDKSGTWAWADARIEGNTIILSSPDVKQPAQVRYGWQNTPPASLYNKQALPAVPFQIEVK